MDPYYEQRLRDEVIYLHSLWHRGPLYRSLPYTTLQPYNSTNFKKHKKKSKSNARQSKKVGSFSGKEWPVKPLSADPPLTQSGWPELKLKPNPQQTPRLPTPEDLEKYNWNQIHQKALKAAKEFFARNGEDSDEEDDDVDDMDEDDEDDVQDEEYDFFWKLFNEDEELKGYYVKHCGGGGEFSCLVCGGANEKYRKRFKDCIALVQHSISIAKTKKLRSHRAYGQVVCKVLGWDIDRLPSSIVADYKGNGVNADKDVNNGGDNAGLNKNTDNGESNLQVDPNGSCHDVSEIVDDESMVCEVNPNGKGQDVTKTIDAESMVCEDLPVVAIVEEENTKKQVLNEAEGSSGGAVTNLCRNLSSTMVLEQPPPPASNNSAVAD
ncbi:uncharacterized protein LOC112501251 isoform X2 [Cynara cardunculus var. scolymus]|uniref:uncharacterized protein LOC112501251 isoform X2 n=1 Tax=Cynara cardunculus var. scolymus TaxID=59895 RepID=UPI000D62F15D|nr:uncharacterized protein LOC112501251 isoform X2 [Cynara cardunculus var. scolymus]